MKKMHLILPAVLIVLMAGAANAQNYPTKPINMIVPFAPGGASDIVARIISPLLTKELGQQIVVDNRGGASGNIGVAYAARASNDGYNLLLGNIGTMAINPALFKKFQVKPVRDFIAVTQVVDAPTALVLHPSIPAKTVKEFIEYAKARPGKLNYGTAGPGSNGRLEMELFMDYTGIDLVQVPYKGGAGAAAIGLISGEVQCGFQTLASVITHVNAGKLKVVGIAAQKRVKALPDVPIMPELGYDSMKSGSWQGLYVPAGTPAPIVSKLFAVMTKVMADPEVTKRLNDNGIEVVTSKSQEAFAVFMKEENEKWAKVVDKVGVVMD
jgi:tripartite-type tricarboxylate transporter receptor subunit TctC